MKISAFILFLCLALSIYGAANYYVYLRGLQALPQTSQQRTAYTIVFALMALAYVAARFLERTRFEGTAVVLQWAGSFWFAALAYFLIIALCLDVLRWANHAVPFFPAAAVRHYAAVKAALGLLSVIAVAAVLTAGYRNARCCRVHDIALTWPAHGRQGTLTLVSASDIHLGTIIGRKRLDRLLDLMQSLRPDVVLLPGDILDEDLAPVIRGNLGESLKRLQPALGLFACLGNHEYIGGAAEASAYLEAHGIRVLRDEALLIDNRFILAGRDDYSKARFTGERRKTISEILGASGTGFPVLLMDHQPYHLEEAETAGAAFQISGHTHNGQFWPFQLFTNRLFEKGYGELTKGSTRFYVSSGAGTWGPPIRILTVPEIVRITLTFKD